MQIKNKTNIIAGLVTGILLIPLFAVQSAVAASVTTSLSVFSLDESPTSSAHATAFEYYLSPNPSGLVTTTWTTNGECLLGHNQQDYATGGSVVTQNDTLVFGLRALDDAAPEGQHTCNITFSSRSTADPAFATPISQNYSLSINDNDTSIASQYSLSTLTSGQMQEGSSIVEQYQINISKAPAYPIVITALADRQCDLLVGNPPNQARTKTVSKTIAANSSSSLRFTLIPVDDGEFEGIHQCSVLHTASTQDFEFQSVAIPSYTAKLLDNESNPNIPDPREFEGGLIYFRDANFDGVEDNQQPQVTSFINPANGQRQALILVNQSGGLAEGCEITAAARASAFNGGDSMIESTYGEIVLDTACRGDSEFDVVWLVDQYVPEANTWDFFDSSDATMLQRMNAKSMVYNLGDKFTTGIELDFERDGQLRFVQATGAQAPTTDSEFEESLVASINNSRLNPIATISLLSALATIMWIIYRKYFSGVNTVKSRYPTVDHY